MATTPTPHVAETGAETMQGPEAGVQAARIEALVVERIAERLLASWGTRIEPDRIVTRVVQVLANRLAGESGMDAAKPYAQRIVEAAANQLIRDQKADAAQEERRRMLRAIRSPQAPHILVELKQLAAQEKSGKTKGAHIPLLNKAYQHYGSYALVLRATETA